MVKALKSFGDYIFHSKTFACVPTNAINNILTQSHSEGRRGRWIFKLQEYDLETKPTKLIKDKD
jgi:hypothetical protein